MSARYRLYISFSAPWILEHRENDVLPVEWLAGELDKRYRPRRLGASFTEYEGIIETAAAESAEQLTDTIAGLIMSRYSLDGSENVFTVMLSDAGAAGDADGQNVSGAEKPDTDTGSPAPAEKKPGRGETKPGGDGIPVEERINALTGAHEFKELCNECSRVAGALVRRNITDSFACRSYVISINDGCGLTTCLGLFAELTEKLGLFAYPTQTRVVEARLGAPGTASSLEDEFSSARACLQGRGGKLICFDISEWITKLSDRRFRDFLRGLEERAGENIIFFRVPFVERNVLRDIVRSINDIMYVRELSVTPFTGEELKECAARFISEKGFEMTPDAWDAFDDRIAEEKSDGRFYGVNTVRKIVRELLYVKQLYNVDNGVDDSTIKKSELAGFAPDTASGGRSGFEQLDELVGMESVARRIREIVAQIEASAGGGGLEAPCLHMRFVGNPGTGKTTVARILGTILKERSILRNGCFFEYSGRDLCGRYVGETAPKTSAICRDAYGSVLFIDEAYSLYREGHMNTADYGQEALDTLVAEMENHRSDLVVIMAGYPDEMERLMSGNTGLRSRMPFLVEFPNYTREQLADIFILMADKGGFMYDSAFEKAVRMYFEDLSDEVINSKDFSNARYVRNLFERAWGKAAMRCQLGHKRCDMLLVEDFALAANDGEFHNILGQKKRPIGFDAE